MKTEKNYEDFTRKVYEQAQEIFALAKELNVKPELSSITFDATDRFIDVTIRTDHGTYEIETLGDRAPKLRFEEK